MPIRYIGDPEWEEQPGSRFSQDDFGLDVIEVPFRGRTDKLAAFLASWPEGKKHPDYVKMFKVGQSVAAAPTFSEVVVRFRGTITGNLPQPIIRREYPLNTATLTTDYRILRVDENGSPILDSNGEREYITDPPVTVFYQSTAYTVQYVAEDEPSVPQYRNLLAASSSIFFHDYDPPKRNLEGTVQYNTDILTTEFTTENAGRLYTVRERHELLVVAEDETINNRV